MSESAEIRKALDFEIGDIVQVLAGENTGALGRIIDIRLSTRRRFLVYGVYIKAIERTVYFRGDYIDFLSHQEDSIESDTDTEEDSNG